jgi:hypothetical protein
MFTVQWKVEYTWFHKNLPRRGGVTASEEYLAGEAETYSRATH